jgi:hypothetical protein
MDTTGVRWTRRRRAMVATSRPSAAMVRARCLPRRCAAARVRGATPIRARQHPTFRCHRETLRARFLLWKRTPHASCQIGSDELALLLTNVELGMNAENRSTSPRFHRTQFRLRTGYSIPHGITTFVCAAHIPCSSRATGSASWSWLCGRPSALLFLCAGIARVLVASQAHVLGRGAARVGACVEPEFSTKRKAGIPAVVVTLAEAIAEPVARAHA